jgi:NAD(P)-dependent dehydrogenase (short-subunit alcohol dehydrogenase family)
MSEKDFAGKVVFLTGAASGIGEATAELLAERGAQLALLDISPKGQAVADRLAKGGTKVTFAQADVTDELAVRAAIDAAAKHFGKLDVLINNAGFTIRHIRYQDFPVADFRKVVDGNLNSVFIATQAAAPHIAKQHGAIVNLSSSGALLPVTYSTCYSAAKAGVINLTRSFAVLLAEDRVRVNAVLPDMVDTPFIGKRSPELIAEHAKRYPAGLLTPRQIGEVLAWLAVGTTMNGAFIAIRRDARGVRLERLVEPPPKVDLDVQPFLS